MTGASEAATTKMSISSGGNVAFNSGYGSVTTVFGCRAWCNLDGTGTISIQASGNISSITDGGTGKYTVTFTNAMPDANYSTSALSLSTSSLFPHADGEGSTTAIVIQARESNDSATDSVMAMAVFR
jgi:hypothetical protein